MGGVPNALGYHSEQVDLTLWVSPPPVRPRTDANKKIKKKKKIEAVNTAIEEDVLGGTFGNDSCRAKMRKDKGFFFVFFFFSSIVFQPKAY